MPLVRCPECDAELDVADADLGGPVECGACGAAFTARAGRRRPRYDDLDEDEDDYDDRPRRRRRRRVTTADIGDARAAVAAPARGLILTGWISAALCLIGGIAFAVLGYVSQEEANNPQDQEDAIVMLVFGILFAVLGTPYCVLIAVGGHRMKRLDGAAWVYTAAALGIATIVLCGPCVPISWAGVGVGIWAIVAVSKPEVKDAIEANRRRGRPQQDEWDDDR